MSNSKLPLSPCFIPSAPPDCEQGWVNAPSNEIIHDIEWTLQRLAKLQLPADPNAEISLPKPGKWLLVDVLMQAIIPQHYFTSLLIRGNAYVVIPDTLHLTHGFEEMATTKIFKDAMRVAGNQAHLISDTSSSIPYEVPYLKLLFPTHLVPFGLPLSAESQDQAASDEMDSTVLKKEIDGHINFYTNHIKPQSSVSKLRASRNGAAIDIPTAQSWSLYDLTTKEVVSRITRANVKSKGGYLVGSSQMQGFSSEDLEGAIRNSRSSR